MNDYVVIITILFRWRRILNAVNLFLQVYKNYKIINARNTKQTSTNLFVIKIE